MIVKYDVSSYEKKIIKTILFFLNPNEHKYKSDEAPTFPVLFIETLNSACLLSSTYLARIYVKNTRVPSQSLPR